MLSLLFLGLIKVVDNIVSTAKTISVHGDRQILSSVLVTISQFLFYFVISKIATDTRLISIVVISIASGIGTFLAFYINQKYRKDSIYTNILTSDCKNDIVALCTVLRNNNIKYIVNDGYTRKWTSTYNVIAFAITKQQSKIIDKYLCYTETKYLRQIL